LNPDFQTGLMVSVVGLTITFLALFIFIGVIMLLKAVFPYKAEPAEEEGDDQSNGIEEIAAASTDEDDEVAAAIAAVMYVRGQRSNQLGASLTEGRSPFWTAD
jgi:sodium pump decarboxylase gamma subunit